MHGILHVTVHEAEGLPGDPTLISVRHSHFLARGIELGQPTLEAEHSSPENDGAQAAGIVLRSSRELTRVRACHSFALWC